MLFSLWFTQDDRGSVKKARLEKRIVLSHNQSLMQKAKTLPIPSATPALIVTKTKFSKLCDWLSTVLFSTGQYASFLLSNWTVRPIARPHLNGFFSLPAKKLSQNFLCFNLKKA